MDRSLLTQILTEIVNSISEFQSKQPFFNQLHQFSVMLTSPLLSSFPKLSSSIPDAFKQVLAEQRTFVRTYIFGSLVENQWDGATPVRTAVSDPIRAWRLYVISFNHKLKKLKDLPQALMIDLILDSLAYFNGYFGEVQATRDHSASLRRDIFAVVETTKQFFPIKIEEKYLQHVWYLLYVVAVSGASDPQCKSAKPTKFQAKDPFFLDLEHNETEFSNYEAALARLSDKFTSEFASFPQMVEYVRKNF